MYTKGPYQRVPAQLPSRDVGRLVNTPSPARRQREPGGGGRCDAAPSERAAYADRAVTGRLLDEGVAVAAALEEPLSRKGLEVLRDRVRRAVLEVVGDLAVRRPDLVLVDVVAEVLEEGVLLLSQLAAAHGGPGVRCQSRADANHTQLRTDE